jgi:Cation transporting ATPase, C-terminus
LYQQFFNEYTARKILNEWNAFDDLLGNYTFLLVSFFTLGLQIFLVEVGGDFVRTSSLNLIQWLVTIALGAIGIPVGILMRFIPVVEDPNTFFSADAITCSGQELEELDSDGELSPELKSKYMELRSDEQKTGTTDADV